LNLGRRKGQFIKRCISLCLVVFTNREIKWSSFGLHWSFTAGFPGRNDDGTVVLEEGFRALKGWGMKNFTGDDQKTKYEQRKFLFGQGPHSNSLI